MFPKNDKAAFESFVKEILHYIYFLNKKSNIFHSYGYITKLKKNDYIKNSHHHKSCCMLAKVKKNVSKIKRTVNVLMTLEMNTYCI